MDNPDTLQKIISQNVHRLAGKRVTLGFDGFVDAVFKVIRQKDQQGTFYFESVAEFGKYTVEKGAGNFSLELEELTTKLGGNMPIMANALARLGTDVSCIGAMGKSSLHPVFKPLSEKASLHSFADPGLTTAMEFKDGKILLAQMANLNKVDWSTIKGTIDIDLLVKLFTHRDLIGILNWSELDHSTSMWKGLLDDILPKTIASANKPVGFFDLSDCSKRSEAIILEMLDLLKAFSKYWRVVLSLNLNETSVVYKALTGNSFQLPHIESIGEKLIQRLEVDTLLIHHSKQALAFSEKGIFKMNSTIIENPMLSTGAGDNFNAGFCAGMLIETDLQSSLGLGHAVANYYMQTGMSPTCTDLAVGN